MSYRVVSFILILISILCYAAEVSCRRKPSEEEVQADVLQTHNVYRAKHGVPPLKLSSKLSKYAQEWAEYLLYMDSLIHREQKKYGENLYFSMGMFLNASRAVEAWYNEIEDYDFDNPTYTGQTDHFTQVIWKSSQYLGVGAVNDGEYTFVVCNYDPPGNVIGQYKENVLPA